MVSFRKSLLRDCTFNKNVFTEARIHQKSAAHFTLVYFGSRAVSEVS